MKKDNFDDCLSARQISELIKRIEACYDEIAAENDRLRSIYEKMWACEELGKANKKLGKSFRKQGWID